MALHSPVEFAQIVDNYIDGWRKNGWMPECRANNLPGWTQGGEQKISLSLLFHLTLVFFSSFSWMTCGIWIGSSADNIVGHFAINYHNEAEKLGIDLNELYSAMLADGDLNPPEWDIQGREADMYKCVPIHLLIFHWCYSSHYHSIWLFFVFVLERQYGYVPYGALELSSTGRQTREGSRTLEVYISHSIFIPLLPVLNNCF